MKDSIKMRKPLSVKPANVFTPILSLSTTLSQRKYKKPILNWHKFKMQKPLNSLKFTNK